MILSRDASESEWAAFYGKEQIIRWKLIYFFTWSCLFLFSEKTASERTIKTSDTNETPIVLCDQDVLWVWLNSKCWYTHSGSFGQWISYHQWGVRTFCYLWLFLWHCILYVAKEWDLQCKSKRLSNVKSLCSFPQWTYRSVADLQLSSLDELSIQLYLLFSLFIFLPSAHSLFYKPKGHQGLVVWRSPTSFVGLTFNVATVLNITSV